MTWPSLVNKRVLGVDPYSEDTGHEFIQGAKGLFGGSTPGEHLEGAAKAHAEKAEKAAADKAALTAANSGEIKSATQRIMAHANEGSEGFTEHMLSGTTPTKGFQCAIPGHSLVKPTDELTSQDVDTWMAQNKELLSKPDVFMGGWTEQKDGVTQLVIEPSENIPKREDAFKAGVARNQVSIWDNVTKKEISTGGSGEHSSIKSKPKPKSVTVFHGTRPENVAGLKENGLTAPSEVMSSKWPQLTDNFDEAHKYAGPGGSVVEFQVPQKEIWSEGADSDAARLWPGHSGTANLVRGDPEGTSTNWAVKSTLPGSYISNVYADGERPADPADMSPGEKQAVAYHKLLQDAYASKYSNNNSWLGKQPSAKLDAANKKKQTLSNTYKTSTGDNRKLISAKLRELEEGEDHPIIKKELKEHNDKLTYLPKLGDTPLDTSHIKPVGATGKEMKPLTRVAVEGRFQHYIDYAKKQGKLGVWKNWYHDAHDQIHAKADEIKVDHEKLFGMVSALSPRMRWEEKGRLKNLDAAVKAVSIGKYYEGSGLTIDQIVARENPQDLEMPEKTPIMHANLKNALRIYYGEHPDSVLRSSKTRSFYNNLRFPGETRDATMDTWMANAIKGGPASDEDTKKYFGSGANAPSFKKYGWCADRVRAVADKNGLKPDETQAVVWMALKDEQDKKGIVEPKPRYLDGNPDDAYFASPPTTNVKFPTGMHPPVMKTTPMPLREGPPGTNLRPLKTTAQGKWKFNKYAVSTKDGEEIGMRFDGDLPRDEQPTKEQAQQVLSTVADLHEKYPLKMTPRVQIRSVKTMEKECPGGHPFAWVNSDAPNNINIQGLAMSSNFDFTGAPDERATVAPGWFMPVFDNLTDEHDYLAHLASLPTAHLYGDTAPPESNITKAQYISAHEYGHCLEFNGKTAWGSTAHTEKGHQAQVAAKLGGAFSLIKRNPDAWNQMSTYGKSNPYEAGAEAFAEYALTDGTTTNSVAQSYARAGKFAGAPMSLEEAARKVTGK